MDYYDFVAIDFETATTFYNSACAIGIAAVKNGEIVDQFYSLLKPPMLEFFPENIAIHGITPEMVKNSPTLDDIWMKIEPYFQESLIIAHNAYFDISVLNKSLSHYRLPNFKFIDSVAVAANFIPGSKSLTHCSEYLNINMGQHHNALDDAITCAKIVLWCLNQSMLPNIGALCFAYENIKVHTFSEASEKSIFQTYKVHKSPKKVPSYAHINVKDIVPTQTNFSEDHPLYQKCIVFTGQLSIDRQEAMQLAVDVGAVIKKSISKKVHFLVVGQIEPEFADENGLSRKESKAKALNDSGETNIQIIDEAEFMALVRQEATV